MADRLSLFGIAFDPLRMHEAVERIVAWCRQPDAESCRYVVTPNVDHVVLFQEREALRAAYAGAELVLVDGMPVVWASRLLRRPLPERVAGSDLVPAVFDRLSKLSSNRTEGEREVEMSADGDQLKVFLLGAGPGVAIEAARRIRATWPGIRVVGTHCPPIGFENDPHENGRALAAIAAAEPDLVLVGLGAPKQELWTHAHHHEIRAKVVLCIGATIDFLAGAKSRSPHWMRRLGLEWLYRAGSEPRRLIRRYARDAWVFPRLVWNEWRASMSVRS